MKQKQCDLLHSDDIRVSLLPVRWARFPDRRVCMPVAKSTSSAGPSPMACLVSGASWRSCGERRWKKCRARRRSGVERRALCWCKVALQIYVRISARLLPPDPIRIVPIEHKEKATDPRLWPMASISASSAYCRCWLHCNFDLLTLSASERSV